MPPESPKSMLKKLCIVVVFGIAFAYIESAVVVYLRTISHPEGFTFPLKTFGLTPLRKQLLLTEIGREAATIVLIATAARLFGRNRREQTAYFLVIFAIWDIFYYVWLKILINWPASLIDWDILFLIPVVWASPVLYPVLISVALFAFAVAILYYSSLGHSIKMAAIDWIIMSAAGVIIIISFCIGGTHITQPDYQSYFYWPLFAVGYVLAVVISLRCILKSKPKA
jgi:hypothetical protein